MPSNQLMLMSTAEKPLAIPPYLLYLLFLILGHYFAARYHGVPASLGQANMPAGWASQISGTFGTSDTIQFDPILLSQDAGYGPGAIG